MSARKTEEVADNGQHALEKISETNYYLIFMDLQMPIMDGLETTRQIRSEFNEPAPYIIALTANAMESDYEAGMDDFLSKPLGMTELKEKLERFEGQFVAVW